LRWAKTIVFGVIIFLSGAAFTYVFRNDVNNSELFELKRNCATLAQNFIDKKSKEYDDTVTWTVLLSDYNVARKSCFGEFNKHVYFWGPGQNFSEYEIYDLLTGQKIAGFTYSPASDSSNKFTEYWITAGPQYEKTRQELFSVRQSSKP
jgi:hypothetical protein